MTFKPHTLENRKTRRKGVATFDLPEEPGLRRKLLEQRQARALGIMDVNTRRLQRKALKK